MSLSLGVFFTEAQLIYNIVLIVVVQQSDSGIRYCMLFCIILPLWFITGY